MRGLSVFICAALSVAACFCASAEVKEVNGCQLRLKASREGSEYAKGETAEFVLTALKGGAPDDRELSVSGEITKDGVPMNRKFEGKLKDGKFSVSAKLDEPGFLSCKMRVKVPSADGGEKTAELLAGAAFSPLEIKPSAPVPDDFDEYWRRQREILSAIPMNVKLVPAKYGNGDIEVYDLQADSFNGKLSAYMAMPKNAAAKSLPAIILAHGAGVRSSSIGSAAAWARRGFLALDFNAHGLPNGQPKEFYKNLADGELKDYRTRGGDDRDKVFFRTLYMRLMRAMDVAMAQPQWDGKTLVVFGGSQGGGQALAAAGLYPDKVTVCVSMYPAMCDHTGPGVGRASGWPHYVRPSRVDSYDPRLVEGARYIDAVNLASRIKCRTFMMINYADPVCAPTSCYAAYNAISAPKSVYVNEESRHAPAKGSVGELTEQVREYLKSAQGGKPAK